MGATQSITRTEGPAAATSSNEEATSASTPYSPAPMPRLRRAETFEEKLYRKFSEEPLVPIGCLATAYCLGAGIRSFYRRDTHNQQKMMRLRVAAQFGTLMIFIGYAGWNSFNFKAMPGMIVDDDAERKKEHEKRET
mmetsp:Transcript_34047/g.74655  ORF Transcript_34047/g.74655 Transcript_34047/m.74655 type:complete len:137 (+) Transcript_34047:115-525(+)